MEKDKKEEINAHLIFKIGEEDFAANASKVQRILELQPITSIPKAQNYMKGVINLMGKVLPVIDARLKMGLPEKEPDNNTCIVVLEIRKGGKVVETGIIVDAVQSVIDIQKEDIKNPPALGVEVNSDFISGMVEQENKFIMLLDVDNVFSSEEIVNLKEVAEAAVAEEK
ncbi:MAG: chemotaxis protein CheW [Salinivirgaceae bacterium]|jgi:purine-binding chemotaxis protein CheW